jgi:amino acid adenylation domain-containing protein
MLEFDGSLSVIFQYNTDLFDTAAIVRMAGHFQTLLEAIVENPQQRLAHLPLLTESERHQLVVEWNDTRKIYSGDLCVHRVFEARVELTPHSTAVVYEDETLTYHELNSRARKLSYYLQKSGVGPDLLIAIYMERSLEMVVGIYGILKAGAAYVPLEAAYPKKRLAFILEDTRAPLLLTQQRLIKGLPHHGSKTLVCLDSNWSTIDKESVDNPVNYTMPRDLAYVIYTSGSTGKPKGAMNSHRGICNRLTWMQDAYQLTTGDRVLQKTPFSFDVSVWEFFWPLFTGASLVVARPGGHLDSAYLVKLIADEKITTLHFVPSMLRVFLEEQGLEACGCLKRVICSGEALPFKLQERFFAHLPAELHNLYGPTEAAVDVTYWACKRENVRQIVPIGRPISNIQIYILDSYLQPVPIGITGELHIGGIGLARGYCNRPELTAEKFIPGLISDKPGARWYKTGDLARYLPDGNIEFLGRLDYQVKIRGFRIELEEIETLLRQHPAVRETIVVTREDAPNDKRLAAYLVPNQKPAPTTSELRSFLETKLPDYMVPATFVILDTLTLTPNGKVDRRALPVPDGLRPELETAYVEPRTEVEHALVEVWKKVLQVKKVGMYDNFFDLGGHSLLMVQVHNMLREMFKQDMSVIELFKYPTISSMAKYLTQRKSEPSIFKNSDDLVEKIKEGKDRLKQQFKRKQLAARRGGN